MPNFNITRRGIEFCGRTLTAETGRMAKQANGSVFIQYGETSVLVTATMAKEATTEQDFFPLTVDYIEKMYASGKIPGGFFKREAKPTTDATLNARLTDRSIRPLFGDGFRNPVHIVINVLSYDGLNDPAVLSIFGASLALSISDIPFAGPIASVTVGNIDDEIVVNPFVNDLNEKSLLNLTVAGSRESIVMIESAAKELSEQMMIDSVFAGHAEIQKLVDLQHEFIQECGKEKVGVLRDLVPEELMTLVETRYGEILKAAAVIHGKQERQDAYDQGETQMLEYFKNSDPENYEANGRYFKEAYHEIYRRYLRDMILTHSVRADGRNLDDIRPITCEVDVLPIVHGSALFTRGETQSLGTVTLGGGSDEQVIDGLEVEYKKHYYLHYNFPPFSVGEAGRMGPPGRRELGHGNLAERALIPVMPTKEEFPYTIRLVCDTLESNGSSSMASVCSSCLAMMAAGVPVKTAVAGIANGLIMEGDKFAVLTDIMGLEDHLGDMDFKVTGTEQGITAMQMDIKIKGITREIMTIALEKSLHARMHILKAMADTIAEPRPELAPTAPRIESFKVPVDKIGEIIGPGGKMIKHIVEVTKVQIDIEDDGTVRILSPDKQCIDNARAMINGITSEPEIGAQYQGPVTRIEPYGVFVKILGGVKEGMVHVSQMHQSRINHPGDMVKLGDIVSVRVIGTEKGKIALAMKGETGNPEPDPNATSERSHSPRPFDRTGDRNRDRDRGDRGRDRDRDRGRGDRFRRN